MKPKHLWEPGAVAPGRFIEGPGAPFTTLGSRSSGLEVGNP